MGRSLLLLVLIITAYFQLEARQHSARVQQGRKKSKITTIYLVRHAEKLTTNPDDQDPDLTEAGRKRAQDLKQFFSDTPVDAFFSTPYKRTQRTLSFLAQGRPLQFYDAHDYESLRNRILTEFKGKTVLVVGHSNTLLPMIEAFGAKRPIAQIADDQYDNIFVLKISRQGKAKVRALKFGAPSS